MSWSREIPSSKLKQGGEGSGNIWRVQTLEFRISLGGGGVWWNLEQFQKYVFFKNFFKASLNGKFHYFFYFFFFWGGGKFSLKEWLFTLSTCITCWQLILFNDKLWEESCHSIEKNPISRVCQWQQDKCRICDETWQNFKTKLLPISYYKL